MPCILLPPVPPRPSTAQLAAQGASPVASDRLLWLCLAALAVGVLALAATLTPDAAGHGTHTQLGLPACGFLQLTGLPCPACGLTTSFSHMIRGQLGEALVVQPLGVVLFSLTFAGFGVCLAGAAAGWSFRRVTEALQVQRILVVIALLALVIWVWRVSMAWLA